MSATKTVSNRYGKRYPWSKWWKAGKVKLVQGTHYLCTTAGMAGNARQAARRAGISLSISIHEGYLTMEVAS